MVYFLAFQTCYEMIIDHGSDPFFSVSIVVSIQFKILPLELIWIQIENLWAFFFISGVVPCTTNASFLYINLVSRRLFFWSHPKMVRTFFLRMKKITNGGTCNNSTQKPFLSPNTQRSIWYVVPLLPVFPPFNCTRLPAIRTMANYRSPISTIIDRSIEERCSQHTFFWPMLLIRCPKKIMFSSCCLVSC